MSRKSVYKTANYEHMANNQQKLYAVNCDTS